MKVYVKQVRKVTFRSAKKGKVNGHKMKVQSVWGGSD